MPAHLRRFLAPRSTTATTSVTAARATISGPAQARIQAGKVWGAEFGRTFAGSNLPSSRRRLDPGFDLVWASSASPPGLSEGLTCDATQKVDRVWHDGQVTEVLKRFGWPD